MCQTFTSLAYRNCRTLNLCLKCVKSQFRKKNPDVLSLEVPGNAAMLKHLIIQFCSIIYQVVAYGRLKTKENFKL